MSMIPIAPLDTRGFVDDDNPQVGAQTSYKEPIIDHSRPLERGVRRPINPRLTALAEQHIAAFWDVFEDRLNQMTPEQADQYCMDLLTGAGLL